MVTKETVGLTPESLLADTLRLGDLYAEEENG